MDGGAAHNDDAAPASRLLKNSVSRERFSFLCIQHVERPHKAFHMIGKDKQ